jgi:Bacterial PH domain
VTDKEAFRLAPPVAFWWVWVAFVAVNVIDDAVQGIPDARFGAVVYSILLLITGLAYTLALRPKVLATDDGITVVNPYRTHVIPWRLITFVDTGEWVQVHYTKAATAAGGSRGFAAAPGPAGTGTGVSSADSKKVDCWALYVSSRARRKIAAGPSRPRDPLSRGSLGLLGLGSGRGGGRSGRWGDSRDAASAPGYASSSRLPDEAKYLASLPPAKAMAVRLDSRADRERARPDNSESPPQATAAWTWLALAAVVIPAIVLLVIAVV